MLAASAAAEDFSDAADWAGNITSFHDLMKALDAHNMQSGTFLVRNSSTAPGSYVLSVCSEAQVFHFIIQNTAEEGDDEKSFCLEGREDETFPDLPALVAFLSEGKAVGFNAVLGAPLVGWLTERYGYRSVSTGSAALRGTSSRQSFYALSSLRPKIRVALREFRMHAAM